MNPLLERVQAAWEGTDPQRRVRMVAAVIAAVVASIGLSWWASSATWRPVLTGQSYDDALVAASALEERAIPYKLNPDGRLDVPASQLGAARAAIGTVQVMPGLHDIGELKLGLTPRAEGWALVRAREGDLAAMIQAMDGVRGARVQIVPRREALFRGEEASASASVLLRLQPGTDLSKARVGAIASLVAAGVDGLTADHVTITDDRGNLLADGTADSDGEALGDVLGYRNQTERRYETAVAQALLPVLGDPREFSVTATVELDLSSSEITTRQVDVKRQAVLSEEVQESESDRTDGAGGVPGVDANLPDRTPVDSASGSDQRSAKSATVTNYIYPTVDEVKRRPAGGVSRLSVAVQVNSERLQGMLGEGAAPDALESLKAEITGAVEAAVGADAERGDKLTVTFLPFVESTWSDAPVAGAMASGFAYESVLPWALAGLVVLLSFVFVVRPMMALVTRSPSATAGAAAVETGATTSGDGQAPHDPDADLADRLVRLVEDFETVDSTMLNRLVGKESLAAAQVVRQWNREASP